MALFEFLMVLVSIIIGLGIAEILTGLARALRSRDSVKHYWVHSLLVLFLFIAQLQQWWESWGLQGTPEWTFIALLLMLLGPVFLFLMAHLLFPEPVKGTDLREYYYGPMRPVWYLGAATVVASTTFRPLVFGTSLFSPDNLTSFLGILAFVILMRTNRKAVHSVLVPLMLLGLLIDIFQWSFAIG